MPLLLHRHAFFTSLQARGCLRSCLRRIVRPLYTRVLSD